jgi:hypothetical protein
VSHPSILLASGVELDFRAPECCPWTIDDIARGLAYTARFRGQTKAFYSVAQHSVIMSREVPVDLPELAVAALFHDAAEAFVGDMPTPLKAMFPDFRNLEREVHASILRRLGLAPVLPGEVKQLDRRMFATEVRDVLPRPPEHWPPIHDCEPFARRVSPIGPKRAHWEFHKRAAEVLGLVKYRALNRESRERRRAVLSRRLDPVRSSSRGPSGAM